MNPPLVATGESYHRGRIWRKSAMLAAVAGLGLGLGLGLAWLRPLRARVRGSSMIPTLRDGDVVVAVRGLRPRRGDLAVVRHDGREMVKRIAAAPGDETMPGWILGPDEWLVTGDNRAASTDSRSFGALSGTQVLARVVWPIRSAR